MRGTNIIAINGRPYDAITGMPVVSKNLQRIPAIAPGSLPAQHIPHSHGAAMSDIGSHKAKPQAAQQRKPLGASHASALAPLLTPAHSGTAAHQMHQRAQRSQTLHRAALKRPAGQHEAASLNGIMRRSAMINKFAAGKPAPGMATSAPAQGLHHAHAMSTVHPGKQMHTAASAPINHRVTTQYTNSTATPPKKIEALKGNELKEHLIKESMDRVDSSQADSAAKTRAPKHSANRRPRTATILTSLAALVLLGGYLTYLNLPSLSIRVAATRAGVDASYPTYQPAGYSFAGPVAFSPGEVRVNFLSNTNDYNYTLVQRSSSWDSQAVLDNYVLQESEQYATLQERGLTIYLMNNKAAWVNGGVLYVIDGDAPLSSEQIQKIASSTL